MTVWPAAVLFDLDGTLIETLPDIRAAANGMLRDRGHGPLDDETVRSFIGRGSRFLVEFALRHSGDDPDDAAIDSALQGFLDHYDTDPTGHGYVYPGVVAVLDALSAEGRKLAVCTNKQKVTTVSVLDGFGLAKYFDVVIGGDEADPVRKPNPGHVTMVLDRLGIAVDDAVMIGDSENDIHAAKAAGVACIAVSFGYCHVPFEELAPDAIVDHYDDMLPAIWRLRP